MIFVTVGTHEQPFNRLVKKIDELKRDGVITEEVIIQTGFSTYEPKYCKWSKLIPYQQMLKNVEDARIVITHGGPASFIMPLQLGNTHPKQYAEDPIGTIMTNIYGCDNLLKLAVEKKARFLLASSVEIYGQGTAIPMNEEYCGYIDCNLARSGYNEAKRTCEALTQSYRSVFGVNAVIARFARVFGADKKHDTKAMSQFMDKAVLGEDIILKSKGQQRYSYCYIADAVSGLLKLMLDGQDGEAYNISNDDDGLTLGEYAEYIASLANLKVRYEIENNESVSKATFALLDTHKIKNIGWKPQYSVKDGLKRTYMIKKEQLTNVD